MKMLLMILVYVIPFVQPDIMLNIPQLLFPADVMLVILLVLLVLEQTLTTVLLAQLVCIYLTEDVLVFVMLTTTQIPPSMLVSNVTPAVDLVGDQKNVNVMTVTPVTSTLTTAVLLDHVTMDIMVTGKLKNVSHVLKTIVLTVLAPPSVLNVFPQLSYGETLVS
jgi:hypothetical protein